MVLRISSHYALYVVRHIKALVPSFTVLVSWLAIPTFCLFIFASEMIIWVVNLVQVVIWKLRDKVSYYVTKSRRFSIVKA
jgi:TM2 domain-containing membrane protein YozV